MFPNPVQAFSSLSSSRKDNTISLDEVLNPTLIQRCQPTLHRDDMRQWLLNDVFVTSEAVLNFAEFKRVFFSSLSMIDDSKDY
jgi:hypothetical protein